VTQPPIRDYALIGDCHGSALVARDGAIDWGCLGRFDAPPVLSQIVWAGRGGTLQVHVEGASPASRRYRPGTMVLETTFVSDRGRVRVTDAMPVWRRRDASLHDYVSLESPHCIVRAIEAFDAPHRISVRARLSSGFDDTPLTLQPHDDRVAAHPEGPVLYGAGPWDVESQTCATTFMLQPGAVRWVVLAARPLPHAPSDASMTADCRRTEAFWTEWTRYIRYDGPYAEMVERSALVLKALTYAPTGALVAAPTTSLPETLGGERNWDYRYCWLRDGTFLLYALSLLGFGGECRRFGEYLTQTCRGGSGRLQIMYGIHHETALDEQELPHVTGYRGSRPVRVGNGAYSQTQLDVYGEVLDWALLHRRLGGRHDAAATEMLRAAADQVAHCWDDPESGLWEERCSPRQHVFGKVMAWVALDRAARLFGDEPRWEAARHAIVDAVHARGIHPDVGVRQAFDEDGLDAAALLIPLLGFPIADDVMRRTIASVRTRLGEGDFLRRYDGADGLDGDEGAFAMCSFWLADALLATGEVDEGVRVYERLLARANDVGLFAEEIDPASDAFLGNHPQALTHLALVQGAVHIDMVRRHGPEALRGTAADRAVRFVGATFGVRGVLAAFRQSGRVGRLWSSRASRA